MNSYLGLILRLFIFLYDNEIACEEVFIKWKEELNNPLAGKQKALFQVNLWLNWLQEEEEDEDEDDDDEESDIDEENQDRK